MTIRQRSEFFARSPAVRKTQTFSPRLIPTVHHSAAFSLIEVAIALGVISFAVVSLIGLMSVGLHAERYAHEDTIVASLSKDILLNLRANGFINLTDTNFSYDYDGNAATGSIPVYFGCSVTVTTNNLNFPGVTNAALSKRLRLEVFWPVAAATNFRTKQIFETMISSNE